MLPKKNRLTVAQFNQIPQKSQELNNNYFVLKIKNNNNGPKFAVIVPKFLDKQSTRRHFTKRLIIEAVKNETKNTKNTANVLIKTKTILKKNKSQLALKQLNYLLKKINVL